MPMMHAHQRAAAAHRFGAAVVAAWLLAAHAPTSADAGAGRKVDAQRGARLIAQYQCGACHTIPGIAAASGKQGPALGAFGRRSYIAGRVPNRPELLARWIARPSSLVPSTTMPDMAVPEADARDMAAWLTAQR